jgi:predicted nucleic-acid-binding Zn-ribbon protein
MFNRKKKAATEMRRTCRRCGNTWFAPKGDSVFTRKMGLGEALSTGLSWTATARKAADVTNDLRCPSCGSGSFEEEEVAE